MGLVNTIMWTHALASLPLLVIAFLRSLKLVVAILVARSVLASIEVPARQSCLMAIVSPDERPSAAGLTSIVRIAGTAVAPVFIGTMLQRPALGPPFLAEAGLRLLYELGLFIFFRDLGSPEEAG